MKLLLTALGLLALLATTTPAAGERGDQCVICHRGIDDAHPKKTLTCTTCHKGDANATDAKHAHAGMLPNPSDLRVVEQTCGKGHQAIAARV